MVEEKEMLQRIDRIEKKVDSKSYIDEAASAKEWGGADVIISSHLSEDVKKWLGDQSVVISFQESEPRRRAVITEFSKELSWLFDQLKNIFADRIDYTSKYDFYGLLAQSAIDYLKKNEENKDVKLLLLAVLNTSKRFLDK